MALNTNDTLSVAKLLAAQKWPYTSSALFTLIPIQSPGLETMAVDKFWRLYYDPAVFAKWPLPQLAGVLLHEVSHCIRAHSRRFANVLGFDPDTVLRTSQDPQTIGYVRWQARLWNEAADMEINDDFAVQGIQLPPLEDRPAGADNPGGLLPRHRGYPEGLTAEEYFGRLRADTPPPDYVQVTLECGIPGQQAAGSAADGIHRSHEAGAPDPKDPGKPDGISEAEAEIIRRDVARKIHEHAKSRGNCPGGWKRWANKLLQPKIDYRRELVNAVKQSIELVRGNSDYSHGRLPRKTPGGNLISPALVSPDVRVTVVIDTSGSMSDKRITEAVSEVAGVLKALPRQDGVRVLAADTQVHCAKRCFRADQVDLLGGGGTDMSHAIAEACEERQKPQLVVVLTDGETGWPEHPVHGIPVLAVICSDGSLSAPSWIKQVQLPVSESAGE